MKGTFSTSMHPAFILFDAKHLSHLLKYVWLYAVTGVCKLIDQTTQVA